MKKLSIVLAIFFLVLASLACGSKAEEWQMRGWTVTPSPTANTQATQTPYIVEITNTPAPTELPTVTPNPTAISYLCVTANEAVNLRPSPDASYYPIDPLKNGTKVEDLGARDGNWVFVKVGDKQGWINGEYLGACN